jgi:hypothetical protein
MKLLLSIATFFLIIIESSAQVPVNWTRDEINPGEDFTLSQDETVFTEGMKSVHMQLNTGAVPYLVSDVFYITPGAAYEFSIDVLDNDTAGQVKVYADFFDPFGFDIFGEPPVFSSDSSEWTTISWMDTIPSQAVVGYILVKFYNQPNPYTFTKTASIWLDNVQFRIEGGGNLVTNGGFEDWTVGVNENPGKERIEIYPNPADDFINVEFPGKFKALQIYNSRGQLVFKEDINNDKAFIPVGDFLPGLYLVRIESDNRVFSKKVLICH